MTLLGPILPIFIIILLGYLCARFGFLDEQATNILARLVFYIIMPVTLFIDVARLPIHTVLNWPYLLAYFISSCLVIVVTIVGSHYGFKRKTSDLVINAMAATQTNTAYLAIPIFLLLFHTINPVAGIILVQVIFNFLVIFSLEYFNQKHQYTMLQLAGVVLWRMPILTAIILGLVVSLLHITLPAIVQATCLLVQRSAPFIALLVLGLSLGVVRHVFTRKERSEVGLLVVFKSFIHPLVALLVGRLIFHLPTFWLHSLVLMAAMPTAKNLYIFAKQYQVGESRANIIVVATTIISMVMINVIMMLFAANPTMLSPMGL